MKQTNETIKVTISSPLIRPGVTLSTTVSKKYAVGAVEDLLEIARKINAPKD